MKKYINYITFFIALTVCKAQTPVFDISDIEEGPKDSYYKDTNGVLDGYDGTYLYTNGNTSLKFVLKKKEKSYSGYYYQDLVVGEFQYIKDGIELHNTLAYINVNYGKDERIKHRIKGSRIITGTELGCPDCSATEKRLRLSLVDNKFTEDTSPYTMVIDIRKTKVNGEDAIKVSIFGGQHIINKSSYDPTPPPLGVGEYLMIKQPYPNTTIESTPFTKNNCPPGVKGSAVIYTVEAGKYSSYISQADADAQAYAEINANGQSNANAKGTCTFINTPKSATFTRNNCAVGGRGGTSLYTVAPGRHTSTISQADADAKADAEISANGQKYANDLGTCSFSSKALTNVGFRKNNCPGRKVGSIVYYSAAAGAFTSYVSQADADAKARLAGQANANAKGSCR